MVLEDTDKIIVCQRACLESSHHLSGVIFESLGKIRRADAKDLWEQFSALLIFAHADSIEEFQHRLPV